MEVAVIVLMFSLLIVAGLIIIGMGMQSRRHFREMEHRERLAMIERGMIPSPETNPAGFDEEITVTAPPKGDKSTRWRTAGIVMIGLGLAYAFLISFALREPELGVGVGGALAVMGAAFFVNSMLLRSAPPRPALPPLRRTEPRVPPSRPSPEP